MNDDNKSSGSLYKSTSSSEDDNDLDGVFIAQIMKEYEEFFFFFKQDTSKGHLC